MLPPWPEAAGPLAGTGAPVDFPLNLSSPEEGSDQERAALQPT